jgi:hypothetical protein
VISPSRVVLVTIGLAFVGALVGALSAGIAFTLVGIVWIQDLISLELFVMAARFGAPVGAIAAPLLSWILLRNVPIWKAVLHTAIGSILAAVIAFPLPFSFFWAPMTGFVVAAARLHLIQRRTSTASLGAGAGLALAPGNAVEPDFRHVLDREAR